MALNAALFLAALFLNHPSSFEAASSTETQPDWSLYHRKDALMQSIHSIVDNNPSFMKIEELHHSSDGYDVTVPVVTVEPGGFSQRQDSKMRLLMSFGEHGREIITTEVGRKLLECFDGRASLKACIRDEAVEREVQSMLPHLVFKIIPIENPNGRDLVEKGNLCERKNGRGVDINRNWDIEFGKKEPDYDPREEYPGDHAFSEPETVILRSLAEDFRPHVWMGMHSGMCAVFMPYDHVGHMPMGSSADAQLKLLKSVKEKKLPEGCKFGPGGKTVGYVAHGTATDYMYMAMKIPLSFTWEIYGDDDAGYTDCFRMFNPEKEEDIKRTIDTWIGAIFHLVSILPSHPDIPNITLSQPKDISDPRTDHLMQNGGEGARKTVQAVKRTSTANTSLQSGLPLNRLSLMALIAFVLGIMITLRLIRRKKKDSRQTRRSLLVK